MGITIQLIEIDTADGKISPAKNADLRFYLETDA